MLEEKRTKGRKRLLGKGLLIYDRDIDRFVRRKKKEGGKRVGRWEEWAIIMIYCRTTGFQP